MCLGGSAQSTTVGTSTTTTTTTTKAITTVTTTMTSTIPPTCLTCTVDYTITTNPSQSGKIDCYTYCRTGGFDCYVDPGSILKWCYASYYGYSFNPTTPVFGRRRRGSSYSPTIDLQNNGICAEDQRYFCCCTTSSVSVSVS